MYKVLSFFFLLFEMWMYNNVWEGATDGCHPAKWLLDGLFTILSGWNEAIICLEELLNFVLKWDFWYWWVSFVSAFVALVRWNLILNGHSLPFRADDARGFDFVYYTSAKKNQYGDPLLH